MTPSATYPDFEHDAYSIKKYIEAIGLFSILLKCGKIVHYTPACADSFRSWLSSHDISRINKEEV